MEDYYTRMLSLGNALLSAVAQGLELGPSDLFQHFFPTDRSTPSMSTLRLNYYPDPVDQGLPAFLSCCL